MDLGVAIGTAAIYGPYVQRFSGGRRMTGQHMNMALLTQQMNASRQKLGIARAMRRMTVQAILAHWRMVPEKRTPLFGMAGVTHGIYRVAYKHLASLAAMGIVAGSAPYLHVAKLGAKQVCGALEKVRPPIAVTGETGILDRGADQHVLWQSGTYNLRYLCIRPVRETGRHRLEQFGMMNAMTRQATHIASVVLPAAPLKMRTIPRVTLKTRFVGLRFCQAGRVNRSGT